MESYTYTHNHISLLENGAFDLKKNEARLGNVEMKDECKMFTL